LMIADRLLAWNAVPDSILRKIVRARVRRVQSSFDRLAPEDAEARETLLLERLESGPVTVCAEDANRQHYEVPPAFFALTLGPWFKYSCCYWPDGVADLARAEELMLELTAERAGLSDGQSVLDLGCGWGSFALWAAERYPHSRILAFSNSDPQRRHIEQRARQRGLDNLRVATGDVSSFAPAERFDRVVSVEMLEHVRNHKVLFERIAGWLSPSGLFFAHVFCHRKHLYAYELDGEASWMTEHFFSGGIMPSWDYLTRYGESLSLVDRWQVEGSHYAKTLRAWLVNLDRSRNDVLPVLRHTYGPEQARLWLAYWRIFFIACEETFALDEGRSYFVGHYLFEAARGVGGGTASSESRRS